MGTQSETVNEGLEVTGRKKPSLGKWSESVSASLALEFGLVTMSPVITTLCC